MAGWRALLDETLMTARLVAGLRDFFRTTFTAADCRELLLRSLARRDARFLDLVKRGIYGQPESPYLPLLQRSGVAFADLEAQVTRHGVESALASLYDAGVRVTLDEFKGRKPIRSGSLEVPTTGRAFDNPLSTVHYTLQSSGSRSPGARLGVDLALLAHEACYERLFMEDFGLTARPKALWRPVPPGASGLKTTLRLAKTGVALERWFSQTPVSLGKGTKHALFLRAVRRTALWHRRAFPAPEYVPLHHALTVARWAAERRASGKPVLLSTSSSCAVRLSAAALDHGLDIRDTFIRAGGEPLTPGKMKVIREAGCAAQTHFAMAEVGRMATACRCAITPDDVHLVVDKVAVLQRESGPARVPGLWLTTLHASAPRIMLNVELGDYGVLETRRCGCVWDDLGFTRHLHTIRSYEKLTAGGMHFMGADLIALVEETLPARFGGAATDYQFVEEEEAGLPRVHLIVSPRVGSIDERAVARTVLDSLAARDAAHRMMTTIWRDGDTLRVVRREPYATRSGKIQTLHAVQPAEAVS